MGGGGCVDSVIYEIYVWRDDNFKGLVEESWMTNPIKKVREFMAIGSNGFIEIQFNKPNTLTIYDKYIKDNQIKDEGKIEITIPFSEPLKDELKSFIENTNSNKEYEADWNVGLNGVILCESALKSANTNKIVFLDNFN